MMTYFRQYLIVGGMPEAVMSFVNNKDFNRTLRIQKTLVEGYRQDIAKYAGNEKNYAKIIFDAIPAQLCKEDKRFVLASIEKGASQRKYGGATQWLGDAGVACYSYNVCAFELLLR